MTLDVDTMRWRLTQVLEKTANATASDVAHGCFVGDKGAERRLRDNVRAGRFQWRAAHNYAKRGLA